MDELTPSGVNTDTDARLPGRHTSGLTSRLILTYLEREAGRPGVDEVLSRCGLHDHERALRDPGHWFDFATKIALLGASARVLGHGAARRIGEAAVDVPALSGLKFALRAVGTPRLVYGALPGLTGRMTRAHRLELLDLADTSARFRYVDVAGVGYDRLDCDYTTGILTALPTMFGEAPAHVDHSTCHLRGAAECIYEVQWARRPSGERWLAAGLLSAFAAGLAASSSGGRRLIPVPLVVAGAAAHRGLSGQRGRRRALEAELRDQKAAAEDLSASLHDLVSVPRLDEVLPKIMEHARAMLVGREIAVLAFDGDRTTARGSAGVPAGSLEALRSWATSQRSLLDQPLAIADVAQIPDLEDLVADPAAPLGALASAPLVFRGSRLGVLFALAPGFDAFLPREVSLLEVYAAEAAIALANANLVERLEALVRTDSLTGLVNHREFQETLASEIERAGRERGQVSVVMLDLDGFKRVNDGFGHAEGDRILRLVAETIDRSLAPGESAARIGGDEFALVLPGRRVAEAEALAEHIDRGVRALDLGLGVSWGVAEWPLAGPSQSLLLFSADRALYDRKLARRTRTRRDTGARRRAQDRGRPEEDGRAAEDHRRSLTAALARAVDAKDAYTRSHCDTVAELCALIGQELELEPRRALKLRLAGLLHDVGKIGVADAILQKPRELTPEEFESMKEHATLGHSILSGAELYDEAYWVLHHHEQFDGAGYPDGLAGTSIPLESRIILVADAFEAMTSDRPYRRGRDERSALAELEAFAGTQFDPECVAALARALRRDARWLADAPRALAPRPALLRA